MDPARQLDDRRPGMGSVLPLPNNVAFFAFVFVFVLFVIYANAHIGVGAV